jgi:hypothetical protein
MPHESAEKIKKHIKNNVTKSSRWNPRPTRQLPPYPSPLDIHKRLAHDAFWDQTAIENGRYIAQFYSSHPSSQKNISIVSNYFTNGRGSGGTMASQQIPAKKCKAVHYLQENL